MPPPTRANSAMDEAPSEKPDITDSRRDSWDSSPVPKPKILVYSRNNATSPARPSPTTDIPITVPPEKATPRALGRPDLAAWVVRTLALVATLIPK